MEIKKMIPVLISIAIEAGKAILKFYNSDFKVEYKEDESPLTSADLASNTIIVNNLKKHFPDIPVLSEESKSIAYEERKNWEKFWLVDPLDGTKEFIKKNGDFTINIALIENNTPILGVVFIPVHNKIYFGSEETGSFLMELKGRDFSPEMIKKAVKLPHTINNDPETITVVASRSHLSEETKEYISGLEKRYKTVNMVSVGSSVKLCLVAEGKADYYPRFGPTMEWDTAPGQAIAVFAGCRVINYETGLPMVYNKENLLNPWFLVTRE